MRNPLPKLVRETLGDPVDLRVIYSTIDRRNRVLSAMPEHAHTAMTKVLRSGGRLLDLQWEIEQFYGSVPQPARVFLKDKLFRRAAQVWGETDALVDRATEQLHRFASTVARSVPELRTPDDRHDFDQRAEALSLCNDELMMVRGLLHRVSR